MIHESWTWRQDLLKTAAFLRAKTGQTRWVDATFVRTEQAVMIGSYAVRKLLESDKFTDRLADRKIKARLLQKRPRSIVTSTNRHDIERHYDVDNGTDIALSLRGFCNQVIHSHVFVWLRGEDGGLQAFIVASDRERNKNAYWVEAREAIALFDAAGHDEVNEMHGYFDEKKQDYVMFRS